MRNQESLKSQPLVLKLVRLYYFESIGISPAINIQHYHIHKTCGNEINNYRKKWLEMTLFWKCKDSY